MTRGVASIDPLGRFVTASAVALLLTVGGSGCAQRPSKVLVARAERRSETRLVYLVLKLGERRVYLMQDGDGGARERLESFPVAIGRKEYATPTGRFRVIDKMVDPDWVQFDWEHPETVIRTIGPGPANPLGPRWIGFTNAYGWEIGFHGTPQPELIGQAVSHGCVRMRNSDVIEIYGRVDVGTPVVVEP